MRSILQRLGLVAGALALSACSAGEVNGTGGSGGAAPTPDLATIRFDEPGTLALAPGALKVLGVTGEPAAAYSVGFALLGDAIDGWLEPSAVVADASTGHALVTLHAPTSATTFRVRASLLDGEGAPKSSAERAVAVSDKGFGTVTITPAYSGQRPVITWTASVLAANCADLAAAFPDEPAGALTATGSAGDALVIDNAPVGPQLAVVVRAGHFAWGCTNTSALTPGATLPVSVNVIDRALDLAAADLVATFSWPGDPGALSLFAADAAAALGGAFLPIGSKDGSVVLNAMAALVPAASAAAFSSTRINKGWDTIAIAHFAALAPPLRERLVGWAVAGLGLQSPSFAATITAAADPAQATIAVTRFGDVEGAAAGVTEAPATWNAEPNDAVLLAGSISWEPSRFAGAAALAAAKQDVIGAASVPDALATVADCPGLASALGGFTGCDGTCMTQLCIAALGARFSAALGSSQAGGALAHADLKASAHATVGDFAEPIGLTGHFIGAVTQGSLAATLNGDLEAQAP